ncbi:hypothetical protein Tco_0247175 [Tanacetum coccineum]
MSQLYLLALSANSLLVKDMMVKLFEIDNERDLRTVADTYAMCQQLHVRCYERREQMLEMQSFLHVSTSLAESYKLLEELQDFELEKCRDFMKSIIETQLKVLKKLSFIAKLHHVEDPVDVALAYREKMVRLFFCHKVGAADLRA